MCSRKRLILAKIVNPGLYYGRYYVFCYTCGALGVPQTTLRRALISWNQNHLNNHMGVEFCALCFGSPMVLSSTLRYQVKCQDCAVLGPVKLTWTTAIKAWNSQQENEKKV